MRFFGRTAIIAVILVSVALLFLSFYLKPVLGDEGILAMDGWRISKGEVPQRDFFQFIPPLAAYIQALFFMIFSPSIFSIRFLGLLYGFVILVLAFLFNQKFIRNELMLALSLSQIVPFGVGGWLFGSHHWLCAIFQLAGALVLLSAFKRRLPILSAFSGVLLGLAVFSLQDQGAYAVMGLFAASIFVSGDSRKLFLISAFSATISFVLLSLPIALASSPYQLYRDWIYFPLFNYKEVSGNQFSLLKIAQKFAAEWNFEVIKRAPFYGIGSSISSSFLFLTPILSVFSLIYLWIRSRCMVGNDIYCEEVQANNHPPLQNEGDLNQPVQIREIRELPLQKLLILTVFSLAFLLGAFHRLALTNLSWAFVALFPFYISLDDLLNRRNKYFRGASFIVGIALILASLSFSISRLHLCLQKEKIYTVESMAGKYKFFNPKEAKSLQDFISEIEKNVPRGEPMYCVGYIPLVNFMTKHPNPTALNFVFPGKYYSKDQLFLWIETIEKNKIIWGISERTVMDESTGTRLMPKYEAVFANDRYILWRRKHAEK